MSTDRYVTRQQRDADGKKLCKVCAGKLPPRRSAYCSDECWYRNTPSIMRGQVDRRDKGVCALCKTQCNSVWAKLPDEERRKRPHWQADHIVPVSEGGGLCGLDGYRTLCDDCHKKETARLAARTAEARRFEKQPLLHGLAGNS
jgi:5-methylcytosine-specific restriction enzyme A